MMMSFICSFRNKNDKLLPPSRPPPKIAAGTGICHTHTDTHNTDTDTVALT
jgi:hypothetical protein